MESQQQAASMFTQALAAGRSPDDAARELVQQHPSLSLAALAAALRQGSEAEMARRMTSAMTTRRVAAAMVISIVDSAVETARLVRVAFPSATPSDMAAALKDPQNYPQLTAQQMAEVLHHAGVFPDITAQQLSEALTAAAYPAGAVQQAVDIIFPPPPKPKVLGKVDLADQAVKTEGASFRPNRGAVYNRNYGGWLLSGAGANMQMIFNLTAVPTPDVALVLLHCTSSRWPADGFSPVNIDINATSLRANFDPATAHRGTGADTRSYVWDRFVIPKTALAVGDNTISITAQSGNQTNYWIRLVQVEA